MNYFNDDIVWEASCNCSFPLILLNTCYNKWLFFRNFTDFVFLLYNLYFLPLLLIVIEEKDVYRNKEAKCNTLSLIVQKLYMLYNFLLQLVWKFDKALIAQWFHWPLGESSVCAGCFHSCILLWSIENPKILDLKHIKCVSWHSWIYVMLLICQEYTGHVVLARHTLNVSMWWLEYSETTLYLVWHNKTVPPETFSHCSSALTFWTSYYKWNFSG